MPILTDDEREGTTLAGGKYALERVIGRGGMAAVFEATHTWTGRKVAVKVINAALTEDAEKATRFLHEARTATAIAHPNVVEVLDMGREETDGTVYIVFELLRGESLRDRLDRVGTLGSDEMVGMLLPLLDALAVAHTRGIVHRDLKPDNIFLQEDGHGGHRPKLLDFGIAKMEQAGAFATGPVSGTVEYMSPERAQGHPTGPTTDVWSLGILMFECLTGALPFDRETITATLLAIVQQPVPSMRAYASVPRHIGDVIDRCLFRTLTSRFRDASELRDALVEAMSTPKPETIEIVPVSVNSVAATTSSPSLALGPLYEKPPAPAPAPRRRALLFAAALLSLLAVIGLWRAFRPYGGARSSLATSLPVQSAATPSPTTITPVAPSPEIVPGAAVVPMPIETEVGGEPADVALVRPRATRANAPQSSGHAPSTMAPQSASQTRRPQAGANGSVILD